MWCTSIASEVRPTGCVFLLYYYTGVPIRFFFLFSVPFLILALLSSPSLPVVTQIRGHIAGPPPPSPLRCVPSFLSREEFSIVFPCRLASNCTYPRCETLSSCTPMTDIHTRRAAYLIRGPYWYLHIFLSLLAGPAAGGLAKHKTYSRSPPELPRNF